MNNDGSFKVGYTAPSVPGQAAVIEAAQEMAGINPETISYIEAHGTGTPLGDPIEVAALTEAFRLRTDKKGFCAIGSAKTNVGHLDTAAGVTGLIKTVLALKNRELPASLHFEKPNPEIDFENSPFYVNTRTLEWPKSEGPRRAGVSSFGIGGTNAHCVLEEAPSREPSGNSRQNLLLLLSAKSKSALESQSANLAWYLKGNPSINLADVAYVTQVGRKAFSYRRFILCRQNETEHIASALENINSERVFSNDGDPQERPLVFMFPGQGVQYVNMALDLYRTEAKFREPFDRCCELLCKYLGRDLREILYPETTARDYASAQLTRTAFTQPALFVIEYSLASLWMRWGLTPQAMIGHSIGEYVAACLAGVFSLETALRLVVIRGRLMDSMPEGAMLAVPLSEEEARSVLGTALSLAAVNSSSSCVVSGPAEDVDELERRLAARGIRCRRLSTSHAFHSSMMNPVVAPFIDEVRSVLDDTGLGVPTIPYLSNVTGMWITAEDATNPEYWGKQLRETVRFADDMRELLKDSNWIFLEVGPSHTLGSLLRQQNAGGPYRSIFSSLGGSQDQKDDARFLLETLGYLWLSGKSVNWGAFGEGEKRNRIPLPTYPFERQRYWIGPPDKPGSVNVISDSERRGLSDWFYVPRWSAVEPASTRTDQWQDERQSWLLFCDSNGVGVEIARQLRATKNDVTTVFIGESFSDMNNGSYTVRPSESHDYDSLFQALSAVDGPPHHIVHLWLVTEHSNEQSLDCLQDLGFRSLMHLAQSIGRQWPLEDIQLTVVSNGLQAVLDEDDICAGKATVLGPCRVIPQEYSHVSCRSVDIITDESAEQLAGQILWEITAEPYADMIAYRRGHRFLQSWEAIRLEEGKHISPLKENGVYVVTGGLGGIGLTLAEHIAVTKQGKLVLINRTPLPDRSAWLTWVDQHPDNDIISSKIRAVQRMEAAGAEVMVAVGNVADQTQMAEILGEAHRRFGAINGVIHSAGVAGGGMIQLKTAQMASSVLEPKMLGTMVLDDLLKDEPLEFFFICSSLASVYGGFGQVDYCAANNFLDAYAQASRKGNRVTIAVNWDTWRDVGMAVNTKIPAELELSRQESLRQGILPAEGAEIFLRTLNSTKRQLAICTRDLHSNLYSDLNVVVEKIAVDTAAASVSASITHPRPSLASRYVPAQTQTEEILITIWQELLGITPIGIHDNFFELGGHSLLAIQLISQLRGLFELEISAQKLFDTPTVAKLAEHIDRSKEELEDMSSVARLLEEVEQLSETEIKLLLAEGDSHHPGYQNYFDGGQHTGQNE